jgi:hypothetical protein
MKLAVEEILKNENLKDRLNKIANEVEEKLSEVAFKTLEKLNEMNPVIANSLTPVIPSSESLKWAYVFKSVSITGDKVIKLRWEGGRLRSSKVTIKNS